MKFKDKTTPHVSATEAPVRPVPAPSGAASVCPVADCSSAEAAVSFQDKWIAFLTQQLALCRGELNVDPADEAWTQAHELGCIESMCRQGCSSYYTTFSGDCYELYQIWSKKYGWYDACNCDPVTTPPDTSMSMDPSRVGEYFLNGLRCYAGDEAGCSGVAEEWT